MCDARHFVGTAALVNSLRRLGHDDPVTVLDLGLSDPQREILQQHCDVVSLGTPAVHPFALAPYARMFAARGGVVVVVDSDVLITHRLDPVLSDVRAGAIVAFPDARALAERWFPEWAEDFALEARLRVGETYVNSGFVAVSTVVYPSFMERWWDCCQRIADLPSVLQGAVGSTAYPDQDALNALLMSEIPAGSVTCAGSTAAIGSQDLRKVRVEDAQAMRCTIDGVDVTLLHCVGPYKPWQWSSWRRVRNTSYARLLRRTLVGRDVAIRVPDSELPIWLRRGLVGAVAMRTVFAIDAVHAPFRRIRRRRAGPGDARS
jgi:hypothetical protein